MMDLTVAILKRQKGKTYRSKWLKIVMELGE